jgi:hypothetical protein
MPASSLRRSDIATLYALGTDMMAFRVLLFAMSAARTVTMRATEFQLQNIELAAVGAFLVPLLQPPRHVSRLCL